MDKSHVTLEQRLCIVCGKQYDTGSILLDTRLRARFERHTLVGFGMCDEHTKLRVDGFVALVECDPSKTKVVNGIVQPEDCYRTGMICHIRTEAFARVFNVPVPEKAVCFVEPGVIAQIQAMVGPQ